MRDLKAYRQMPANRSAKALRYHRARRRATPGWADKQRIAAIYAEARARGMVVDHIVPLEHPLVSGLHVPENLRVITWSENTRKASKFEV